MKYLLVTAANGKIMKQQSVHCVFCFYKLVEVFHAAT